VGELGGKECKDPRKKGKMSSSKNVTKRIGSWESLANARDKEVDSPAANYEYCSETSLTGEPDSIACVGAFPEHEPLPPSREANSRPTRLVRLCNGMKLLLLFKLFISF
jgi:hypothetical protein